MICITSEDAREQRNYSSRRVLFLTEPYDFPYIRHSRQRRRLHDSLSSYSDHMIHVEENNHPFRL